MAARPIFYDTETTGINFDRDYVIEIAAFDSERNKTYESLIKPPISIPKEATAIHNITDEMVANAHSFSEVCQEFLQFCEGEVILIAHNNDSFDLHFLRSEFRRCDKQMPSWRFFDTLKWARRYRTDLPRHSLQFLREIYGFPQNNAHRALDDVIILHKVFCAMVDDLTIEEAYQLLHKPRLLKTMPFGKHQGIPFESIPKHYFDWLQKSGAFEKPDNKELQTTLEHLGLLA